jgi:hypothetical protein
MENRAYILTTLAFYLLTGRLILEMPANWLITLSTAFTFTSSLTYAGLNYINREGLKYWILSFILNLAVVTIFVLLLFSHSSEVPSPSPDACKENIRAMCQAVGEGNVSIPTTCVNDNSIMRGSIPYDLKEASNLNDTKVVCP